MNAYWSPEKKDQKTPSLKNLNINFAQGKLYGVVGRIDSGKSSLLKLLLKEMPAYSGSCKNYAQKVAYVG